MVELKNFQENAIKEKIENMLDRLVSTEPFNKYYGNIKIIYEKNYAIFINNFNEKKDYDILNSDIYNKFDALPNPKYSTQEILVYTRPVKELEKILTYPYYKKFNFETFVSYQYNPSLFSSENINNNIFFESYILTPTVTPYTKNIVVIKYDQTAYDFYFDDRLFIDMYVIHNNLGEKYLVFNSLELGSLPEVYHYHIQKVNLIKPSMKKLYDGLYEINGGRYIVENRQMINNPYAKMYCINISEIGFEILKKIFGIFLWNCRFVVIDGIKYKFSAQIFFYKFDGDSYLMFGFRKNRVSDIVITPDGYLSDAYYDQIYGDAFAKYGIIYLPVGIIHTNNYKILSDDLVVEIKNPFHYHPNISKIFKNILKSKNNTISKNLLKLGYLSNCLSLNKFFNNKNKIFCVACNNLPILYKYSDTYIESVTECGLMDIGNNMMYYIKINNLSMEQHIENEIASNMEYVYPKYYGTMISNERYMLFEQINTNLDIFIEYEWQNLYFNDNVINAFLVQFYYCIKKLSDNNLLWDTYDLQDILVAKENRMIVDYNLNLIDVSISRNNTDFKINCHGYCLRLKFKKKYKKYDASTVYLNFVRSLNNKLSQYEIYNNTLQYIINDTNFAFDNIYKYFYYAWDILAHRPPYYECLNIYQHIMCDNKYDTYDLCIANIPEVDIKNSCGAVAHEYKKLLDCLNMNGIIDRYCKIEKNMIGECTEKYKIEYLLNVIKNKRYEIKFDKITIPKGTIFVSGTNNSLNDNAETYAENKYWTNQISYLAHYSDLNNPGYLSNLFSNYMKNNTLSRIMIYSNKRDVEIYKVEKKSLKNNIHTSQLGIDYNFFPNINDFVDFYSSFISDILFEKNMDPVIFQQYIDKWIRDNGFFSGADVVIQDLFNFCLKTVDSNMIGYSNYNPLDQMIEYIVFRPVDNFDLVSVLKPFDDQIIIFDSINIFNNYMSSAILNFTDNVISTDKFNKELLDIILNNNDRNDNKKLFVRLMEKLYPKIFLILDYIVNNEYNLFTKPIMSNKILYKIKYTDIVNQRVGGFVEKYTKYKKKNYLQL